MEIGEGLCASLVVFHEPSEASGPCEGPLDDPSSGQEDEAAFGLWQLDDLERDAMFGGRCCGLLACITLIDEGDLDALGGLRLNGLGDLADFGAIVGVGGRDVKNQKMSKRVDRQMQLRALLSLCAVVGCARPTFRRRAQGSAVDDGDGRLRCSS